MKKIFLNLLVGASLLPAFAFADHGGNCTQREHQKGCHNFIHQECTEGAHGRDFCHFEHECVCNTARLKQFWMKVTAAAALNGERDSR